MAPNQPHQQQMSNRCCLWSLPPYTVLGRPCPLRCSSHKGPTFPLASGELVYDSSTTGGATVKFGGGNTPPCFNNQRLNFWAVSSAFVLIKWNTNFLSGHSVLPHNEHANHSGLENKKIKPNKNKKVYQEYTGMPNQRKDALVQDKSPGNNCFRNGWEQIKGGDDTFY